MKVNLIHSGLVDLGFGRGQAVEDLQALCLDGRIQRAGRDDGGDIRQMAMVVTVMILNHVHQRLAAADAVFNHRGLIDGIVGQPQLGQLPF